MQRIVVKVGAKLSLRVLLQKAGTRAATRSCCSPVEKTKPHYGFMSERVSIVMESKPSWLGPRPNSNVRRLSMAAFFSPQVREEVDP